MRLLIWRILLPCLLLTAWLPAHAWCQDPLIERFIESRRIVSTVYFDDHSYLIPAQYRQRLEGLADELKKEISRGRFIRAEGFAGDEGREVYSFKLSLQRAKSVVDFFSAQTALPEIYLTGYGDLQAGGSDSQQEWRVEIVSYENVLDVSLTDRAPGPGAPQAGDSPISNRSLLDFQQGHMEALSKFDEPLIIDALAIEQALMEKLGETTPAPNGAVSQVDWSGPTRRYLQVPKEGEVSTP